MFIGTPTWKAAEQIDVETSTPAHLLKAAGRAKLEADATAKREKDAAQEDQDAPAAEDAEGKDKAKEKKKEKGKGKKAKAFVPIGNGPYLLSKYSKLVDAGHQGGDFKDR